MLRNRWRSGDERIVMDLHSEMMAIGNRAVVAARKLAGLAVQKKNRILCAMADALEERGDRVLEANNRDMDAARNAGLSGAMLDRLELNSSRVEAMANDLRAVSKLKDPVGKEISHWIRPSGLVIRKVRVPIGVIAVIYESRPNVTADAAGLCFKTSNAVILRGGKESIQSNKEIVDALQAGGAKKGLPDDSVQLITTSDRDAVRELVQLEDCVNLAIPRGGEALIRAVMEHARVPVIKHYKGICHTYVDKSADPAMALRISENAKCERPAVCNAMETVLVHRDVAQSFLPELARQLGARGVEFRADEKAKAIVPEMKPATEEDWSTEYLALILSVKVVESIEEAIEHITKYGSKHSDAIITQDEAAATVFFNEIDSATVYWNASTRFTDGGEFGMGAEIGISTDKLHARGPMGLEELTTYKYLITGSGQVRD